jgi:hypothetical protein
MMCWTFVYVHLAVVSITSHTITVTSSLADANVIRTHLMSGGDDQHRPLV